MKNFFNITNITLLTLMAISSVVVFFQAQRVLPLVDYTYQLENAYRIYSGQMLYKDFVLSVAPGTYVVMALLMKMFGLSNLVQIIYIMLISSLTLLLTYKLIKRITHNQIVSILLSAPLVFCGHSIFPFPNYDINTTFFILLSLIVLFYSFEKKTFTLFLISGILIVIPPFFKQNTGLIYTSLSLVSIFILTILKQNFLNWKHFGYILLGAFLVCGLFAFWLLYNNLFREFIFQVFISPSQSRPLFVSFKTIILQFLTFNSAILYISSVIIWIIFKFKIRNASINNFTIIIFIIVAFIIRLLTSNFPYINYTKSVYFWYDISLIVVSIYLFKILKNLKTDSFLLLLPIVVVGVSYSSFLSQGVIGSSYGIWPLFFLMIAFIYKYLTDYVKSYNWLIPVIVFVVLISMCLGISVNKNTRLSYIPLNGKLQKATRSNFEFVATPGNWISEMEECFTYIDSNIPKEESIIGIPGEDPIYFATQRTPELRYFSLNSNVCPFSEKQICNDIMLNNIKWIILKTNPQMPVGFFSTDSIKSFIKSDYKLVKVIKGYEIYRK